MFRRIVLFVLPLLLFPMAASAQFVVSGTDPSTHWKQRSTANYTVIYPAGMDSLSVEYATELERVRDAVGGSIGFVPNQNYRKRMPVVLHPFTSFGNGMVTWTPRRVDLYTTPGIKGDDSTPWVRQLVLHESRHIAQMQLGAGKPFFWTRVLTGEIGTGALAGIYGGPAFLEGDAVFAETSLTSSGRGRSGSFLEYYRASFFEGQMRIYWQWRYGSLDRYTPDHYRIGYFTNAGLSEYYDCGSFSKCFYDRILKHRGWAFWNLQKTTREISGKKFSEAWMEMASNVRDRWEDEASLREPFTSGKKLSPESRRYTDYHGICVLDGKLYAIRSGIGKNKALVQILPDSSEKKICLIGDNPSPLRADVYRGRLFWSESVCDPRWEMRYYSVIRYMDATGKVSDLTGRTRLFNPSPCPVKDVIALTSYPEGGGSSIVLIDSFKGRKLWEYPQKQMRRFLECAWVDSTLYASVSGPDGLGIVNVLTGETVLEEQTSSLNGLQGYGGELYFVSDASGVNEIYRLSPGGSPVRITSSRIGSSEYAVHADSLYFANLHTGGRVLYSTPLSACLSVDDFFRKASNPTADYISSREKVRIDDSLRVEVGPEENYSRIGHALRLHSWAPLYVNYNAVSSMSMESLSSAANLGATLFFQNTLGSLYGFAGVRLCDSKFKFRPSFHADFTWRGIYPVFEAGVDVNDRNARIYEIKTDEENPQIMRFSSKATSKPLASFNLKMYVPLRFSKGGINKGIIPQITYVLSNEAFSAESRTSSMGRLTASLRAYAVRNIPSSCIYPKLGVGLEAGYSTRPVVNDVICSNVYAHMYAYLPGIGDLHGIKLTAMIQRRMDDGLFSETLLSVAPRGFGGTQAVSRMSAYPVQSKVCFDYAMPFASVD